MSANICQTRTLAILRCTLLPKLLNGELQADSVVKEFLTTAADGKSYTAQQYKPGQIDHDDRYHQH